jgi:hypothetical protein
MSVMLYKDMQMTLHLLILLQISVLLFYCFSRQPTTTKQGLITSAGKIFVSLLSDEKLDQEVIIDFHGWMQHG